jgi:hypothetical protein
LYLPGCGGRASKEKKEGGKEGKVKRKKEKEESAVQNEVLE